MNQFDLAASAVEAKTSTKIPQPTLPAPQIQPLSLPDQNASRARLEEATNVSAGEKFEPTNAEVPAPPVVLLTLGRSRDRLVISSRTKA